MTEYKPQKMASKPIFMIGFTVLAIAVSGSLIYDALVRGAQIQWSSIAFGLGVVVLLWYSRWTSQFYIRLFEEHLEWKVSRSTKVSLHKNDIQCIEFYAHSIDFITSNGTEELPLTNFDKGPITQDVIKGIKTWAQPLGIRIEDE